MTNFAARIAGVATLALAALPVAAIATAAHAAPMSVKVGDLNLNSPAGLVAFNQRSQAAATAYCRSALLPRSAMETVQSCRKAIKTELNEKLPAVQQSQLDHAVYAAR